MVAVCAAASTCVVVAAVFEPQLNPLAFTSKYFTVTGGVACLLQKCIKSAEIAAYEELGAEAIYKLEVENMRLTVAS